jgi:hypothetical protein
MQRFDENGNFVNLPKPEIEEEVKIEVNPFFSSHSNVVYEYVDNKSSDTIKNEVERNEHEDE